MPWCHKDSDDESEDASSSASSSESASRDSEDATEEKSGCEDGLFSGLFGRWRNRRSTTFVRSETLKARTRPHTVAVGKALLVDNEGKKITDYYDVNFRSIVGEGGYATVCIGTSMSGQVQRAIKCIRKDMVASRDRLKQEIQINNMLDHPNIAKIYETFEDRANIYLVMELCSGGELFDRIHDVGSLSEKEAAIIMQQILKAVSYMHKNGVAHRDLKPENFLFLKKGPIEGNTLKVIDFGIAGVFEPGTDPFTDRTGTPYYVAPEVLPGGKNTAYGKQCDVWSCGVVMYVLVSGRLPFKGAKDQDVLEKVRRGKFSFPTEVFGSVSEDAKALIRRMLTVDPKVRCTAEEALNDVWTRDHAPSAAPAPLVGSVVQSIGKFVAENRLKKAAMHIVARHLEESQTAQLKNIFLELDKNGDGHLTVAEVTAGLKNANLSSLLPDNVDAFVASMDTDGSGEIDYTEFLAATIERRQVINESVCRSAFRVFDTNDDGRISLDELAKGLASQDVANAVGRETVARVMAEVDKDGNGEIDFQEFMAMMRG